MIWSCPEPQSGPSLKEEKGAAVSLPGRDWLLAFFGWELTQCWAVRGGRRDFVAVTCAADFAAIIRVLWASPFFSPSFPGRVGQAGQPLEARETDSFHQLYK
ncbi:hypothetical protein VIN7_6109 [Saccharomyces cerevisiae x Saccharomyces kudriavzevii VIN7]|uniref:Uncharacterized protein n=1 Tax=Saccharomyces cerevisiae x Saccharomyces kudriavzevii (strain VIN7) TaxID=1095631 RepID=H0GSG6_SACCK|nr:hypothetical protein VIN7_6109 [Saccharomyces cerevisiae x Saccharomyces kudriavzevii VIN7]